MLQVQQKLVLVETHGEAVAHLINRVVADLLLPEAVINLVLIGQRPDVHKGLTREIGRHR